MSQQDQLGARALKLLAEESMVAVLRGLADRALRPAELEHALPDAGHSLVMRRLRHLLDSELVTYEHQPGLPPHAHDAGIPHEAHYSLTDAGRMLLDVAAEADRWKQTWCSQDERRDPAGTLAIKLTADYHSRKITLLLADGPLCTEDLDQRAPDLGRKALRRRLGDLRRDGYSPPIAPPLNNSVRISLSSRGNWIPSHPIRTLLFRAERTPPHPPVSLNLSPFHTPLTHTPSFLPILPPPSTTTRLSLSLSLSTPPTSPPKTH